VKFSYSQDYFPSAPVIEIRLAVPEEGFATGPLTAFVDSGADATLIPARFLKSLSIQVDDRRFLRSQWGEARVVDIFSLDIGIGDLRLPAMEIVSDELGNEVIIGKNVLNLLRVVLNGPTQTTELFDA